MHTVNTDVLIVGAGPAGLTAAALLARQGISSFAVTKYAGTANGPRAHVTNQRTLEVMRDLGIEARVHQEGQYMANVPDIIWATTLAGREIARRPAWGTRMDRKGDYEQSSPCHMINIAQNLFEPVILRRAVELGADIRFNTELTEIAQDPEGVTCTVRYRPDGHEYSVRARYVIGADGGRSTVASQLGFEFDDELKLGYALNAYIEADLEHLVAHRRRFSTGPTTRGVSTSSDRVLSRSSASGTSGWSSSATTLSRRTSKSTKSPSLRASTRPSVIPVSP